jgi:glyoxylase-like metal-dependent hydrolase (beta-lactamase superfamily II)
MQLGDFTVDWLSDGVFKLDGGAMFGPVPKPMWEKKVPADARNRIPLGLNCILITTRHHRILLDTGLGNKIAPKQREILAFQQPPTLELSLKAQGLGVADIDHVVMSHCDYDHLGGATKFDSDGRIVPTFPKATYHIRKEEWDDLTHPNMRAKGTYLSANWEAIAASNQVNLIERDGELLPGLSTYHTGGHTRGHIVIEVRSGEEGAVYMGDLMPSHHHLNPLWVMAYDNFPLTSIEQRGSWTRTLAERDWWLLLYHDVDLGAGRWDLDGNLLASVPAPSAGTLAAH